MEPLLIQGNIVIVAPDHKPNVVSKEWLHEKDILKEAAINFVHHQNFSLVETTNFSINVVQQLLTITAKNPNQEMLGRLSTITKRYVKALPDVSYNAIGLNSNWSIRSSNPGFLKSKFVVDKEQFDKTFHGEANYNIGGILYYEHNPFRVQLTIVPQQNTLENDQINAGFNYHLDLTNPSLLSEAIPRFTEMIGHARNIIKNLLGG